MNLGLSFYKLGEYSNAEEIFSLFNEKFPKHPKEF